MLPHDDDAKRLVRSAYHFGEFFEKFDVPVPTVGRRALLWGHCHHKATGGTETEQRVLERMGIDVEQANGGCCGLAGSWGFEQGKREISIQCAELGLLPAVREADGETVVVANGFSCKTQLQQSSSGRRALHLAQVMKLARERGPQGYTSGLPEDDYYGSKPPAPPALGRRRAAALGGAAAVGAAAAAAAVAAARR